jgi:xanthine dehydrogenase/oxidase
MEAVKSARMVNGAGVVGDNGGISFGLDSPATAEKLRLAVGDDLVQKASVVHKNGEKAFFVAVS